jgi:hypothetical protein
MDKFLKLSCCFAAVFLGWAPVGSTARTFVVPGCKIAQKLVDGSWLTRSTANFGRAGAVASGSVIHQGSVVNGLDLGRFLESRCFQRYELVPDYPPYLWPPNGYPNIIQPVP